MRRERALKVVLVVVGVIFCALAYPLIMFVKQEPALAMQFSVADGLGSFTFKELHLLPRVVFGIGAVFFGAGLFHSASRLLAFGLGLIFLSVAYNLAFDFFLNLSTPAPEQNPRRFNREREALMLHSVISFLLACYCFYAIYSLRQGSLPFLFEFFA